MTPAQSPPALTFEAVSKQFGRIKAVDGLSLEIRSGQIAGFLGPNGAGKSTSLFMIPKLVRPTTGRIRIFGVDVWQDFKRAIRSVGVMVETPAFYEYLSGRRNLELAARVLGNVTPGEISEVLERIGLAGRQHDRVGTYSMGMKQRLGVGRTLLGRPKLLVLDEPTNGMDPEGTREILSFLREKVNKDGLTLFLSSHLMSEVEEYCDTVFVINGGRLVASGAVREILKPHEQIVRVVFCGVVPRAQLLTAWKEILSVQSITSDTFEITLAARDAAWLNRKLVEQGFGISSISAKQKTLKEFFFFITGSKSDE